MRGHEKIAVYLIAFSLLVVSAAASVTYIYEKRYLITAKLSTILPLDVSQENDAYGDRQKQIKKRRPIDRSIAHEIMQGGYILHFRHAERNKWIDVLMYDALEANVHTNGSNSTRYAEEDYFDKAVCLNERGKV